MINLPHFLLCALLVNILLIGICGCGTSFNQKNYLECRKLLEEHRQKIRLGNGYTYNSQSFEECRAPARFQTGAD